MAAGSHKVDFNIIFSNHADKALIILWCFNLSLSVHLPKVVSSGLFSKSHSVESSWLQIQSVFFWGGPAAVSPPHPTPACRVCRRRCPRLTWRWFCKGQQVDIWRGQRWERGGESAGHSASRREGRGGKQPFKWPHKDTLELIKS